MSASAFMQHTSLPGSPVVAVDPLAYSGVYSAKGWTSHPGPITLPTFAPPATRLTTVKIAHTNLPGRTVVVPYDAYYGTDGWQGKGWTIAP